MSKTSPKSNSLAALNPVRLREHAPRDENRLIAVAMANGHGDVAFPNTEVRLRMPPGDGDHAKDHTEFDCERWLKRVLAAIADANSPFAGTLIVAEELALAGANLQRLTDWKAQCDTRICIEFGSRPVDVTRLEDVLDLADSVTVDLDSHIPAVLSKVRPMVDAENYLRSVSTLIPMTANSNTECVVKLLISVFSAPFLCDALQWAADLGANNFAVVPLEASERERHVDPLANLSAKYVDWLKLSTRRISESRELKLNWRFDAWSEDDFRPNGTRGTRSHQREGAEIGRCVARLFPQLCGKTLSHLDIGPGGETMPCEYVTESEINVGNLLSDGLDKTRNGHALRELRTEMVQGTMPQACQSCAYHRPPAPIPNPEFVRFLERTESDRFETTEQESLPSMEVRKPIHASWHDAPPLIVVRLPNFGIDRLILAISSGGDTRELHFRRVNFRIEGLTIRMRLPTNIWDVLVPHQAYWWMLWAIPATEGKAVARCHESRCFIKASNTKNEI